MTELEERYWKQAHQVIAVDYDGTITEDRPYPEVAPLSLIAKEYLEKLHKAGFTLVLWTARLEDTYSGVLDRCRNEFGMPFIEEDSDKFLHGATGKLVCAHYIDDKGVLGKLDWEETYNHIMRKYSKHVVPRD